MLTSRRMSERYPAISQLIAENRIPEFDNLCKLRRPARMDIGLQRLTCLETLT